MAQRNNDEIKKDIEDIGKFSKTAGRDLDSLKAKLESFFNKYTKLTTSQKKQLADIISEYDNLEDALEKISKENTKFKDISDDILQTVQDIKDELREQSGIYTRLTKIINEQVDSIDEEKTLVDKINKSREHSSDVISKNNILSKVSLDILSQQLKDLRLLEAISVLDKNTVSEDFLDRLKQSRITSKEIVKLLNLQNKLQTINSEILGYQNELKDTKNEEERVSIQKTISKLEGKSLKIKKEYNTYAKENKDIINKTLADRTKSVAVLLSEKKQLRQINDIYSEYASRVDDNLVTYSAIARLIPGIGDDLSNAFLEANHIAQDSMRAIKDKFIETRDPIESLQAGWSIISKTISKIPAGLVAIGIAVGLIAFAVKGVYDLFIGILEKANAIQQETGIASDQAYDLYKNALAAQTSFSNQLSTLEDIVAVQTSFINNFGRFTELTSTTLSQISDAAKVFGYSAETAARLQGTFMELGADEAFAGNLQIAVANLAKANKIAPGIIAKDLVENSEMIAKNFAGMPIEAAKAAIETRKLGYSLQQAGKIQDHLFDIQGSLTSQMEASVALGRLVNTNEARRLALNGDIAGMMREISKEAGSYADFQNMSVPQRMLLAKSFGLEVSELQRSLYLQEKLSDLSDKEMEYAQKHLKNLEGVESMTAGQLKAEISRAQEAEKFNVLMQKFKNQLMRAILPLAEALLPIFEALVSVLQVALIPLKIMTPIFKLIGFLVEGILTPLRWVSQLFDWILSGVSKFADSLFGGVEMSDKLAKMLQGVIGVSALLFLTWSGGFKKIGGLVAKLGSSFTSLFNPKTYQKFFSGFSSMGEKVFGKFYKGGQFMPGGGRAKAGGQRGGGLLEGLQSKIKGTAESTSKIPKSAGAKGFLSSLSEGLKSMGTKEVLFGAANLAVAATSFLLMIPASVGMLLLSALAKPISTALSFLGKGLQRFGLLMSSGGLLGATYLSLFAIALGAAVALMTPAIEALSTVFTSIFDGVVNVIGALSSIDASSIAGLFLLGPALISFGASLAIASVAIVSAIPAMLLFGIAFSMFSNSISKASEPILQLSDSIASLVDNLMKLTSISLSTIKEDIKGLGDVSKDIKSDISAVAGNVKVNSSIQSSPISTAKTSGEEPKTTTKSFEERNNALGDNSTVRMLSRLVALMEQSTANPPNLVLEFDDGTVSRLKTRIKKTV